MIHFLSLGLQRFSFLFFLLQLSHFGPQLGLLFALDLSVFCPFVDVARNGEVIHQHVVETVVVGVEEDYRQSGSLEECRSKARASLLDSQVRVFVIGAGQGDSQGAVGTHCFVGVGVEDLHIINSCPLQALLQGDRRCPCERERVVADVAVSDRAQQAVPYGLATNRVAVDAKCSHDCTKQEDYLGSLHHDISIILPHKHLRGLPSTRYQNLRPGCQSIIIIMSAKKQDLSPRVKPPQHKQSPPESPLYNFVALILPPFLLSLLALVFRTLASTLRFIYHFFQKEDSGESSRQFHRRRYEEAIESLDLQQEGLGFTNQVLVQEDQKSVNLYLPVYVTCKIKSIQDVSVHALTGNISCALIVNIGYGDIPKQVVKVLENSIKVQLNMGDIMILADDGLNITLKRNEKAKFLIFTIRKVFLAFMQEDTVWSPFELLELIISLTFNTVTIPANTVENISSSGFNPKKEYKISFNCMRNSDEIPLSFALDCVYGVYDLAERRLESYHSRFGTYKEIQKNYEEHLSKAQKKPKEKDEKKKEKEKDEKKKKKKDEEEKGKKKEIEKEKEKKEQGKEQKNNPLLAFDFMIPLSSSPSEDNLLKAVTIGTMRRLSMREGALDIKKPPKKVKYFQYTHLIIPLYKYPGNALFTIFLPTFLLALLSLAIFFQEPQLSGRIGAIATMILGYIALIPSIKDRLPPSSKLTVIETIVYIQTVCCLLILYQSFTIRNLPDYVFVWYQNICFLLCLGAHSFTFLFVVTIYSLHKLVWQPSYNSETKVVEIKPADNIPGWDNPYCDLVFHKFNKEIRDSNFGNSRQEKLIKPYKLKPCSIMELNLSGKSPTSQASSRDPQKGELKQVPVSPRSMSQFFPPSEQLYYGKEKDI